MANISIYDGIQTFNSRDKNCEIIVSHNDLIDQIFLMYESNKKITVLDHACYDKPAPMFPLGYSGVEESLCAHSDLYSILCNDMRDYFRYNAKHKNNGLYLDRGFYIENLDFTYNNQSLTVDVVGATAPNYNYGRRYHKFNQQENSVALFNRIDFLLSVAAKNKVDLLIVGPFGCSVYGQDITEVASIFKELLTNKYRHCFEKVCFNTTYEAFYQEANRILS